MSAPDPLVTPTDDASSVAGAASRADIPPLDAEATARLVPEGLRDRMVILADGTIAVSSAHARAPEIQNATAEIWRLAPETGILRRLPLEEIARLASAVLRPTGEAITREIESEARRRALAYIRRAEDLGVSDIHVTVDRTLPPSGVGTVDFRVHGEVRQQDQITADEAIAMMHVLYGEMAEEGEGHYNPTVPQKARIPGGRGGVPATLFGIRVQTTPLMNGTLMVLRLLPSEGRAGRGDLAARLGALGFDEARSRAFGRMVDHPTGIVVLSGPTGSGKSTTLMVALRSLRDVRPHDHILTLEDPPEYRIEGVKQIPVQHERWGERIEEVLRLDPDVVMVGEVRSPEGATGVLRVANTGHLVLTTVHANSAWKVLTRLVELTAATPENQALLYDPTVLRGLVAQRLLRRLCPGCARRPRPGEIPTEELRALVRLLGPRAEGVRMPGEGCPACAGEGHGRRARGIAGRTVVAELVELDHESLERARREGVAPTERRWREAAGSLTFFGHWLEKLGRGEVAPDTRRDLDISLVDLEAEAERREARRDA